MMIPQRAVVSTGPRGVLAGLPASAGAAWPDAPGLAGWAAGFFAPWGCAQARPAAKASDASNARRLVSIFFLLPHRDVRVGDARRHRLVQQMIGLGDVPDRTDRYPERLRVGVGLADDGGAELRDRGALHVGELVRREIAEV